MSNITGIWYNGKSSRGQAVRLSMPVPVCLQIENDEGVVSEFDSQHLSISTRLGSTHRTIQIPDQAMCNAKTMQFSIAGFQGNRVLKK